MLAVKSMDVRDNFKILCDKVFNGETLIVSRPKNENVVMMSESEYNELQKAKRNAEYLEKIDRGMEQIASGNGFSHDIIEVDLNE
jgi:antitoxin YefM